MTTLRALECLVALVDEGSVTKAAALLHMSHPALSHQIAGLERELDTPVVERMSRGVRVTAAGRAAAAAVPPGLGGQHVHRLRIRTPSTEAPGQPSWRTTGRGH